PYTTGRDTYETVQEIVYAANEGDEAPQGTHHYEELVKKGAQLPSADQDMHDDDLAGLFYTGGTTGRAKGVMLSHGNIVSNAIHVAIAAGYNDRDTYLHTAPMFHMGNTGSAFALTLVGARNVFNPMFNPVQFMQTVQDEKVTLTFIVPAMFNAIINHPDNDKYDFSSMRRLAYGASP
ncbi:MAG TPA: fatty-acid--CoA ligase, partial [Ktedonobacter sp.]|nr:fatty-acid--CoA ligase [Ktedonobacter sp.]